MVNLPTPTQKLHHPLLEEKKIQLYVKRDDLTHPEVMGNKWRKLKYNLKEALHQEKKGLVTMGGAYSNHIAAVAALAHEHHLESIGIIRGEELNETSNVTLEMASKKSMQLEFLSRDLYRAYRENHDELVSKYQEYYYLPEGGTNELAIQGCKELLDEVDVDFDIIVSPIGTGGTFCGLLSGIKSHQKLYGYSSLKGNFIDAEISALIKKFKIPMGNYEIIKDYHFGGYAKTNPELIEFMNWFKENFDIQLDPIYTGKSFFGVWDMIKSNKFEKNLEIVLLHTGGLQGIEGFNRKNENIIQ